MRRESASSIVFTMTDRTQSRLDAAWKTWIEAQEAAIETVRSAEGVPRTETDMAEGYRWVTRLSSLAQEWFIEKSDPLHPAAVPVAERIPQAPGGQPRCPLRLLHAR